MSSLALGPSATRGRLALLSAVRAFMPLFVYIALSLAPAPGDRSRIAGLLTAQVAFGFAALAVATGRRTNIAQIAVWTAIAVDLLVIGALVAETGGIGGPLAFLFGGEALAVGMLFPARDGLRVLFAGMAAAGIIETIHPAATAASIEAMGGVVAVSAIGIALSALNQREARRRALELSTIRRIAMDIQQSLSLEEILADLCKGAVVDLGFTTAAVLVPAGDGTLSCAGACGLRGRRDKPIPIRGGIAEALNERRVAIVTGEQARATGELSTLMGGRGYIAFPMGAEGLLVVTRIPGRRRLFGYRRGGRVRAHELDPLMSLAQQAAIAVANAQLHEHVSAMAVTDPLTALPNHGEFQRMLASESERQRRYSSLRAAGHHLSVVIVDIDRFKSINDGYGHPAGDEVLKQVAEALRRSVRSFDLVARYGGEEFGIVLPETDEDGAMQVAERARHAVEALAFEHEGHRLSVTVSVGVATAPEDGLTSAQLVAAADAALYRSKATGRNRVTHFTGLNSTVRSLARKRHARSA